MLTIFFTKSTLFLTKIFSMLCAQPPLAFGRATPPVRGEICSLIGELPEGVRGCFRATKKSNLAVALFLFIKTTLNEIKF